MNNTTLCWGNNCQKLSNDTHIIRRPANDLLPLMLTLAGSIGILPNLIIILGVYYKKSLRKPTYYLLANLSLCDLLLSAASLSNVIMITISRQNKISHQVHVILCKMLGIFPIYLSYSASVQTLIIISGERYQAIFRPTSQLSAKKAKFLCLIAWIVSLFISFPFIITTTVNSKPPYQCLEFSTYTNWTTIMYLVLFVFQFALPTVIMITLYAFILHQLRKTFPGQNESCNSKRLKRRTIYMLLITTIIFLIFSALWAVSLGIMAITGTLPAEIIVHPAYPGMREVVKISRLMLPFTAIYNPIIYCIFNPHIRQLYTSCCKHLICMKTSVAPAIKSNSKCDHVSTANSDLEKEVKSRYLIKNVGVASSSQS